MFVWGQKDRVGGAVQGNGDRDDEPGSTLTVECPVSTGDGPLTTTVRDGGRTGTTPCDESRNKRSYIRERVMVCCLKL